MQTPRRPCRLRRRAHGLTLVELLVTLAIAAVLLTVAAPSLAGLVHSVHLSTTTNTLLASLRLARSEAIKRASRVTMCKSVDGAACTLAGGWEQGWIVFHDPNANGALDAGEKLIQRGDALGGGLVASGNSPVARAISFAATAGPRTVGGGLQAGTLTLCRRSVAPGPARRIVLGMGGRARIVQADVASCY